MNSSAVESISVGIINKKYNFTFEISISKQENHGIRKTSKKSSPRKYCPPPPKKKKNAWPYFDKNS